MPLLSLTGAIGDYTWDLSLQFNKTDYDTYECCYLQKPEYTEAAAAFSPTGSGTFKGQTDLFHPDVVAYYTASPSQTANTQFKNLEYTIGGPLKMIPNTDFVAGIQDAEYRYQNFLINKVRLETLVVHQVTLTVVQDRILLCLLKLKLLLWTDVVKFK